MVDQSNKKKESNASEIALDPKIKRGLSAKETQPEVLVVPSTDDSEVEHYGSRAETNAALEDKIALQNTIKLHEHF